MHTGSQIASSSIQYLSELSSSRFSLFQEAKGLSGGETAHDLESKEFVQETPSLRRRLKSCSDHWDCPEHERCNRNNKCVPNYTADKARRRCADNYGCPTKERCTRGWCELKPKYADKRARHATTTDANAPKTIL
eukprot:scaffold3153_cov149-Skeletonema_marinoi.AAC.20